MPHILPCPAPRGVLSDSSPRQRSHGHLNDRKDEVRDIGGGELEGKAKYGGEIGGGVEGIGRQRGRFREVEDEREMQELRAEREELRRRGRECPVPKPRMWFEGIWRSDRDVTRDGERWNGKGRDGS